MKVTVCQLPDAAADFSRAWSELVAHARSQGSELVLLPEMPFFPWFAASRTYLPDVWRDAALAHEAWLHRLPELAPAVVLGSRPINRGEGRHNEGFVWSQGAGYKTAHLKYYLPDEIGFWEASWYSRGDGVFEPVRLGEIGIGFMICTDLWFLDKARLYGKRGVHLVVNPRATELATNDKWLVGGRAAAIVSGAYCLSSNRVSPASGPQPFGGQGWIVDPDGKVLALTSNDQPFVTVDIDPRLAEEAKKAYPRYAIF